MTSAGGSPAEPLQVLVNLTWLVPGVVGGSEEATTDSIRAVLDHHPEVSLRLAVLRTFAAAHPDLVDACRCEVLDQDGTSKARRVLAEQRWLAERTRSVDPDVTHHAGGVVPLVHPGAAVVTIHDLQPLDLPGNFRAAKRFYSRAMLGRSASAAAVVAVPSEFTARRVHEALGTPSERIRVVPWSRRPAGSSHAAGGAEGATNGPPVFLYPAITYPHKEHLQLLEAFALVLAEVPDARLVLPGGPGPLESAVLARIDRPDLRGRVSRPGRVPAAVLEDLYAAATVVVVPSSYEGFGLPALEAMEHGVPVLVSDAGSLPEVVPTGALAPVAGGAEAWSAAMVEARRLDPVRRSEVLGHQAAALERFTPRRTAEALVDAYRTAATEGGSGGGAPVPDGSGGSRSV